VMNIAGAASSGGGSDSATLQQLLGLLQTVHADVQKIGADLGDKTLA